MNAASVRNVIATLVLLVAAGCGSDASQAGAQSGSATTSSGNSAQSLPSGVQPVAERFERPMGRAFRSATEGRSPTMACTGVVARAAGTPLPAGASPDPDAVHAFQLCYVEVSARYFEALLAAIDPAGGIEAKDETCAKIAAHAVISRTSLGSFAGNIRLDPADLDQQLAERVGAGMSKHCPSHIEALTGYR